MTRYPSNRERLMETAGELLYREGAHAVSVDRLADEAGLTKPTIYNLFGSKDALVAETLERRAHQLRASMEARMAAHPEPARKLMELLEVHAEMLTSDGFHGCPLLIAAVQSPESERTRELAQAHKTWLQSRMAQLARRAGFRSPDGLAWTLLLLIEGAAAMSAVHPAGLVIKHARAAARTVLDGHR
jgi:AcrR family transcriptional regulator